MSYYLKAGLVSLVIAFVVVLIYRNLWPAYYGAWKAHKSAEHIAEQSAGKNRKEVVDAFLSDLATKNITNIDAASVTTTKDGDRWIVGAEYETKKPVIDRMSAVFTFNISSNRKTIWLPSETPTP